MVGGRGTATLIAIGLGAIRDSEHMTSSRRRLSVESLETRLLFAVPGVTLGAYHTYTTLTADLQTYANFAPSITRLVSLGSRSRTATCGH